LVKFSLATWGRFTLMPSLVVIPANIRINYTSPGTRMVVLLDTEDRTIVSSFI